MHVFVHLCLSSETCFCVFDMYVYLSLCLCARVCGGVGLHVFVHVFVDCRVKRVCVCF